MLDRSSRLLSVTVLLIGLHSLLLGFALLFAPMWTLETARWSGDVSVFFAAQSGLFLIILGSVYLAGLRDSSLLWVLVLSKALAAIFLVVMVSISEAPRIILLQAILDAAMGLTVFVAWRREAGVPG
jgi:hypothetical protein